MPENQAEETKRTTRRKVLETVGASTVIGLVPVTSANSVGSGRSFRQIIKRANKLRRIFSETTQSGNL